MGGGTSSLHRSSPIVPSTSRITQDQKNLAANSQTQPNNHESLLSAGKSNIGDYNDRTYELFQNQENNEEKEDDLWNIRTKKTTSGIYQDEYHEYDASNGLGRAQTEREWEITYHTTTSRLLEVKSTKSGSLPEIYPCRDVTRGTRPSSGKQVRNICHRDPPISNPAETVVLAPTTLGPTNPSIDEPPDMIDSLLSPKEIIEMNELQNHRESSVQPSLNRLPTISTKNLLLSSGISNSQKETKMSLDTANMSQISVSKAAACKVTQHIDAPSSTSSRNTQKSVHEPISTSFSQKSSHPSTKPMTVTEVRLQGYDVSDDSDGNNTSVSDHEHDSEKDEHIYDWIDDAKSQSENCRVSMRVSETIPNTTTIRKSSFFNVIDAATSSIRGIESKRFSIDMTPLKTDRRISRKNTPTNYQDPPTSRSETRSQQYTPITPQESQTRPQSALRNKTTSFDTITNLLMHNPTELTEVIEGSKVITVDPKVSNTATVPNLIPDLHINANTFVTEQNQENCLSPVLQVQKMTQTISKENPGEESVLDKKKSVQSSFTNHSSIKETKDVKRNIVHLPNQIYHPKPTAGDWINKRYFVNDYILLDTLGKGSYGEVRLCRHRHHDSQLYAMKIISRDMLKKKKNSNSSETFVEDIKREIAIMKKLLHPNVLRLFEVLDDQKVNKLYLVLEHMSEGDLITYLRNKFPNANTLSNDNGKKSKAKIMLNDLELWNIFRQVISGIKYLHYQNVIHGDIKPQNLLVGKDGIIRIADFGISRILTATDEKLRDAGGTPAFMSPELCSGESFSGQLADVWAIGATMFMLKFGRPPFVAKTILNLYHKIQNDELVFPFPIDSSLQDLFSGMLEKDPSKRLTLSQVVNHPWLQQQPIALGNVAADALISTRLNSQDDRESPPQTARSNVEEKTKTTALKLLDGSRARAVETVNDDLITINEEDIQSSIGAGRQYQQNRNITPSTRYETENRANDYEFNDDMKQENDIVDAEEDIMQTNWGDDVFEIVEGSIADLSDDDNDQDTVDAGATDDDKNSISPIARHKEYMPIIKASISPKTPTPMTGRKTPTSEKVLKIQPTSPLVKNPVQIDALENSLAPDRHDINNTEQASLSTDDKKIVQLNGSKNALGIPPKIKRDHMNKDEEDRRMKRFQNMHSKKSMVMSSHRSSLNNNVASIALKSIDDIKSVMTSIDHNVVAEPSVRSTNESNNSSANNMDEVLQEMILPPVLALVSTNSTTKLLYRKPGTRKNSNKQLSAIQSPIEGRSRSNSSREIRTVTQSPIPLVNPSSRVRSESDMSYTSDLNCDDPNELSMEAFSTMMDTLASQQKPLTALIDEDALSIDFFKDIDTKSVFPSEFRNIANHIVCAYYSEQGHRVTQEDRCIVCSDLSKLSKYENNYAISVDNHRNQYSVGGIFDGHSGQSCSHYLVENFLPILISNDHLNHHSVESIEIALRETCLVVDDQVCKYLDDTNDDAGSTGAFAVYDGVSKTFSVANVGDSICVLSVQGKAIQMNKMHRIDNKSERERIINSGGSILNNRLDGVLAITRAFGDCAFKLNNGDERGPLTSVPDIISESITSQTEFAIIATDGLWDVISPQVAVNFIRKQFYEKVNIQEAVKRLTREAFDIGSVDNITALVMVFNIQ